MAAKNDAASRALLIYVRAAGAKNCTQPFCLYLSLRSCAASLTEREKEKIASRSKSCSPARTILSENSPFQANGRNCCHKLTKQIERSEPSAVYIVKRDSPLRWRWRMLNGSFLNWVVCVRDLNVSLKLKYVSTAASALHFA